MDAFLYFKRSRGLLALLFVLALLFAPVPVRAETEIRSLTGITPSTMKANSYNRTKENKMKTTLILITIITSLFFSACANNNRVEPSARRAANASFQEERLARAQKDLQMTLPQQLPQLDATRWNTYMINY